MFAGIVNGIKQHWKPIVIIAIVVILILSAVFILNGKLFNIQSTEEAKFKTGMTIDKSDRYFCESYQGGVVIAKTGSLSSVSSNLTINWEKDINGVNPIVKARGNYVLTYFKDAKNAYISDGKNTKEILTEDVILFGNVNKNGYFSLVTSEAGYKNQVIVYSPDGSILYKWHSADNYVVGVEISPSNDILIVSTMDTSKTTATGGIMLFNFNQDKPYAGIVLDDSIIIDVKYIAKNRFVAVGDNKAFAFNNAGDKKWEIDYGGSKLSTYDISSIGNTTLVLNTDDSLLSGSVVKTYDTGGKIKGEFVCDGHADYIDTYDNEILISSNRKLTLISDRGHVKNILNINKDIVGITFFPDKKNALVASGSTLQVYRVK